MTATAAALRPAGADPKPADMKARVLDVTERTVYRWRSARPVPARPAAHPTNRKEVAR